MMEATGDEGEAVRELRTFGARFLIGRLGSFEANGRRGDTVNPRYLVVLERCRREGES